MVQISKVPVKEDILEKMFLLLFQVIGLKKDKSEFNRSIECLFSPTEKIMVAKRLGIYYLLLKGVNHAVISQVLKVSSATVAKFALLNRKNADTPLIFDNLLRNETIALVLEKTFSAIFAPGVHGVNWQAAWERKKNLRRKEIRGF